MRIHPHWLEPDEVEPAFTGTFEECNNFAGPWRPDIEHWSQYPSTYVHNLTSTELINRVARHTERVVR